MPGSVSSEESGFFTDIILRLFPSLEESVDVGLLVRKLAHFTEFMILGILLTIRLHDRSERFFMRFFSITMTGLFAAFTDETIQIFVEGRGSSVADMWIDFAGVITGCLITLSVTALIRSKKAASA